MEILQREIRKEKIPKGVSLTKHIQIYLYIYTQIHIQINTWQGWDKLQAKISLVQFSPELGSAASSFPRSE